MTPNYPHHSAEGFMENATPVQSFVSPALEMGPEERARPRLGRPTRKPAPQAEAPKADGDAKPDAAK